MAVKRVVLGSGQVAHDPASLRERDLYLQERPGPEACESIPPGTAIAGSFREQVKLGVDEAIGILREAFRKDEKRFFTEADVADYVADHLRRAFRDLGLERLIHREYPTPMRLDMAWDGCVRPEEDRAPGSNGKYRWGPYDLVVLNPRFLEAAPFEVASGQVFDKLKPYMDNLGSDSPQRPPLVAAIEFAYRQQTLKTGDGLEGFLRSVRQAHTELAEARECGFVDRTWMIVLTRDVDPTLRNLIETRLTEESISWIDGATAA